MKIAILIPTTSKNRNWPTVYSSYLYKTLNNLKDTLSDNYEYYYYIGIDEDDIFYNQDNLNFFNKNFNNIFFIKINCCKGHLTKIWNILCYKAYDDKNDYYYSCGDDIEINKKGWINECIIELQYNDNIGVSGLKNTNGNLNIITQPFVHKTHIDIFGYFYPEEIINWYCDNWINEIYSKNRYIINNIFNSTNNGNEERYDIVDNIDLNFYVNRDTLIIQNYLSNLFNYKYYLFKYDDLKNKNKDELFTHWHNHGKYEGRSACLNITFYINHYKDLINNGIINDNDIMNHWINNGRFEERYMNEINYRYNIYQKKTTKVFSFCLYGNLKKYIYGMFENIDIIHINFPEWFIYIYYDDLTQEVYKKLLNTKNVILIKSFFTKSLCMLDRFFPIDYDNVDVMIVRDSDSRIHPRDIWTINEFIKSDKKFHIIRDHKFHGVLICGGLWGIKKGLLNYKFKDIILNVINNFENKWGSDQLFLEHHIYDNIKHDVLIHSNKKLRDEEILTQIPFDVIDDDFCGQVINYNGDISYKEYDLNGHVK
jgi:hypothetical protein